MKNKDKLKAFFMTRPHGINRTKFAKSCGISRRMLVFLTAGDRPFTKQIIDKINKQINDERYLLHY